MAKAVDFSGKNLTLAPPRGEEGHISSLPIFTNGVSCSSCWELDVPELLAVAQTGKVWLTVYSGRTQPPVYLGSEQMVRSVAADYGPLWPTPPPQQSAAAQAFRELIRLRDVVPDAPFVAVPAEIIDALLGGKK